MAMKLLDGEFKPGDQIKIAADGEGLEFKKRKIPPRSPDNFNRPVSTKHYPTTQFPDSENGCADFCKVRRGLA